VGSFPSCLPLRWVAWIGSEGATRQIWPEGTVLPEEVPAEIAHITRSQVLSLHAEHSAEVLALPLGGDLGTIALGADTGAFGDDLQPWRRLGAALRHSLEREQSRQGLGEREALLQRAEESEALHILGLSANRSLDPDEVLALVARSARTLLGAHYVTVSTTVEGQTQTVAGVGLGARGAPLDDAFAAVVVEQGKPLTLGAGGDLAVDGFPLHALEEARAGLGVPLSLFGETFGALVVGYRRDYHVVPRDFRLALTLAGHAAVAISNARLHRALADRSRELEQTYEELRWSSQAKERFFASMSHELRTPLNAIIGYHSLLLDAVAGELPSRQRGFVESANRATQSLLRLVNDVLDLSKIEAGKMELVVRPVDMREIIHDTLSIIEPMATPKGIRILTPPPPEIPPVYTDADRVRQILVNLLSNAVKFTDQGTVTLTLERGRAPDGDPNAEWVVIRVEDTGSGIAPENHERIFHEFEQVTGATSRGGTGLGLPISRKLARLLGGELRVESSLGAGSTFTLRLPLRTQTGMPIAENGRES
jgi:signal transduction histidine kinase